MKDKILVYGHKNPDTDSICSSLAVAYLKNQMVKESADDENRFWGQIDRNCEYISMAAGKPNSETAYVLDKFGVDAPKVDIDIRRQIRDIDIKWVTPLESNISLKETWMKMQEEEAYTAPVTENGEILGIISTGDISRTYMNVHDNELISKAKTPYKNLLETIQGRMIVGDENDVIDSGKVLIIAANPEMMGINLVHGDIALLSNDVEGQKKLIECGARCMIITLGIEVTEEVRKMAEEKNVTVIVTPFDTYKVAKIINQSIPSKYFVLPKDEVCGFNEMDYIDDIRETITTKRHRDFPVLDAKGDFKGMISRTSLLDMPSKKVILVDHNEMNQAVFGLADCQVVEIIDHHKLGTVETMQPISVINRPVGCTATIVYGLYKDNGIEIPEKIKGLLISAILSDTMLFKSPTCTEEDKVAATTMAKEIGLDLEEHWSGMLRASLDLDSKSEREIMYQDYKRFESEDLTFGAGQILAASDDDVAQVKERMCPYLATALEEEGIDFVSLMITNVSTDATDLIFCGDSAKGIIESAFGKEAKDGCVQLPGVVSRKKQLIPPIMSVLQK